MTSTLLQVKDLYVSYGPFKALFGVSFELKKGNTLAIVGSNGAGKSSLVRAIGGLVKPVSGSIYFEGINITTVDSHKRRELGIRYAPEGRSVFTSLTVEENLKLFLCAKHRSRQQVSGLIMKAYQEFPWLAERRNNLAGNLSGGEQKLLSLVSALIDPTNLFIADELSLGLAPVALERIWVLIERLRAEGRSLLIVEQDFFKIRRIADQVIVLKNGKLAENGKPQEIKKFLDIARAG